MQIVITGPQGSGKTTKAAQVCRQYGLKPFHHPFNERIPKTIPDKSMVVIDEIPDEPTLKELMSSVNLINRNAVFVCGWATKGKPRDTTGQRRQFTLIEL